MRLDGKVAVVTGGGSGLGRAIAELYAEEGAHVVVADLRPEPGERTVEQIKAAGGDAIFVAADVSSSADVQALIGQAEARYGRLDVMTANAGILGRGAGKSLAETTEEEFLQTMDVNFGGVMLCFKYAIPAIQRAGGGAMTATTSLAAHRGFARLPAYCASKAAVVALVQSVAADLAPSIRVNAVSAGAMRTDLMSHASEEKGEPLSSGDVRPRAEAFGGRADPREVAFTHLYLVSDESSFITGQALMVDGGRSVIPA